MENDFSGSDEADVELIQLLGHVVESGLSKHLFNAVTLIFPMVVERARLFISTAGQAEHALFEEIVAVDGDNDFVEGNLGGGFCQGNAASRASLGRKQIRVIQLLEDLRKEGKRNVQFLADRSDGDVSVLFERGQVQRRSQSILAAFREQHESL